jgi:hypothetical protein
VQCDSAVEDVNPVVTISLTKKRGVLAFVV